MPPLAELKGKRKSTLDHVTNFKLWKTLVCSFISICILLAQNRSEIYFNPKDLIKLRWPVTVCSCFMQ